MILVVGFLVFAFSTGFYLHSSPLLKRGVRTSDVNVGQVAQGSVLLLEYTPVGGPARQYTVGPFPVSARRGRGAS